MHIIRHLQSRTWQAAWLAALCLAATQAQAAPPPPTGQVTVIKHIKAPPGGPPVSSLSFSVSANCTPAATPGTAVVTAGPGAGQVTFTAPIGATCTIVENTPMPAFPANVVNYCAQSGLVPVWNAPTFNPGTGTVLVNSNQQIVQLRNSWKCAPAPKVKLTVKKRISNPGNATPLTNMIFSVSANCTPTASPVTQTVNNGSGIGSIDFNVAAGATCTVVENTPLPPFPASANAYCAALGGVPKWNPPSFGSGGGSVMVGASGATVYLLNSWACAKNTAGSMGQIEVIKELTTLQTAVQWPASTWVINVNCNPPASGSVVSINTPASGNAVIVGSGPVLAAPVGAACTVNEPASSLPPFPPHFISFCNAQGGKVPKWNPPSYSPSSAFTVNSGVTTVWVKNSWQCV